MKSFAFPRCHAIIRGLAAAAMLVQACHRDRGDDDGPEPRVPGQSYFSPSGQVEYIAGDLPVLLIVPHGGTARHPEIPDRVGADTNRDSNTQELARAIDTALTAVTGGGHPHVVMCHLHRVKLDCNREIVEAAQGDPLAEQVWSEFHALIDSAKATIIAQHGRGFALDVHGHGHEILRLELGYELDAAELAEPDSVLDGEWFVTRTSLREIRERTGTPVSALIRGPLSFGTLMDSVGYDAVPSQAIPAPGADPFFAGGYNTQRHGSRDGGTISALQLEVHRVGARDTEANRHALAVALAAALQSYLQTHLGLAL